MEQFAPCDKCGEPVDPAQGRYTIADEFDDDGNWTKGRHAKCQERTRAEYEDASKGLDASLEKAKGLLNELRRQL